MKLFGGKRGGHRTAREPLEQPNTAPAVEEKEPILSPEAETAPIPQPTAGPAGDRRKKRRRVLIMVLCAVLLALVAGVTVYFLWEKPPEQKTEGLVAPTVRPAVTSRPTPPPTPEPEETEPPETPAPEETEEVSQRKEDCYTVVILAMDQVGTNTDAVLVLRLDAGAKTLDVVSIPRDTLVNVSWGVKKINTVYGAVHGDMESFNVTLCGLLGFAVDAYAVVDGDAVAQVVDTMGGVNFYLPRDMDYDDPSQNLSIHLSEGFQYLSGENVVKVLRFRLGNDDTGYATGDLGRISMQHELLKSVGEQLLQRGSIPNLEKVIDIFRDNVSTDLSANNLAWFAREFLLMDKENVHFYTAPGHSVGIRGGSYYELEPEPWLEILNEALNPYHQPITEENLDVLRSLSDGGAISTTGEVVPNESFLNFYELG